MTRWQLAGLPMAIMATVLTTPAPALACVCADGGELNSSAVEARVREVISEQPGWVRVRLEVLRRWRDTAPEGELEVVTRPTGAACGVQFIVGRSYLVDPVHGVFRNVPPSLAELPQVHLCGGTLPVEQAAEIIARLETDRIPLDQYLAQQAEGSTEAPPPGREEPTEPPAATTSSMAPRATAPPPSRAQGCGSCAGSRGSGAALALWLGLGLWPGRRGGGRRSGRGRSSAGPPSHR